MTVDYVLKRAGMFVLIIFVAGTLNFAIPRLRPTNPVEERMNSCSNKLVEFISLTSRR